MGNLDWNTDPLSADGDLLSAHPLIRAASRDTMAQALERAYAVRRVDFGPKAEAFSAVANRTRPGDVQLHYCRYDGAASVSFADMSGFRQMINLAGAGEIRARDTSLPIDRESSAIVPPNCDFTGAYEGGYAHLVVQYDEQALRTKWELITGGDARDRLSLPTLRTIPTRRIAGTQAVALALAGQFAGAGPRADIAVSELSQALITTFLLEHSRLFGPTAETLPAAPAVAVARLEDFIQAHWRQALTVEAIAAACGVSVRSVFAQFKRRHGVSPMAYLRDVRLEQARLRLSASPAPSVIDVAMACGFQSFGHFARRYRERFGELPSETLQRRQAR